MIDQPTLGKSYTFPCKKWFARLVVFIDIFLLFGLIQSVLVGFQLRKIAYCMSMVHVVPLEIISKVFS